jgi:hypothetical protein
MQGAPQAPSAQAASEVVVSTAIPTTRAQIRELQARRSEISSQIGNISGRREDIAKQLREAAPGADRAGLEARLSALDGRIVELENELNVTGKQLASAKGDAAAYVVQSSRGGSDNNLSSNQMTGLGVVFMGVVPLPLTITWCIRLLKRGRPTPGVAAPMTPELTQRFERIEQGIEAVAIEVERISEGQRFVTRVLGEHGTPALGPDAAEPIPVPAAAERVEARRA